MKILGLICEYNPFHNGHVEHIILSKEEYDPDLTIVVTSGFYTMRGEVSLMTPHDKAKLALQYGADLVIMLPFFFTNHSADYFSYGAVKSLNYFNVTKIICGSETCDLDYIENSYNEPLNDKSISLASSTYKNNIQSNDILALSYLKAIKKVNPKIDFDVVQRTPANESICSATNIRKLISNSKTVDSFVPIESISTLQNIDYGKLFNFIKLQSHTTKLSAINISDEGLDNRILKYIDEANSFDNLVDTLKSKKHSQYRIKRFLINVFNNVEKTQFLDYETVEFSPLVLGFNDSGKKHLRTVSTYQLNLKEKNNLNALDIKVFKNYTMISNYKENFIVLKPIII